jgi:hypothetical protein
MALGCSKRSDDAVLETAELQQDLRLDANTEMFPAVGRVYVGPLGQIALPVQQEGQVRIYDSTGKRIRTVGRRGQGPGEFTGLGSAGWIADTLWVIDSRTRRTTYFAPDGSVLRVVALPTELSGFGSGGPGGGLARVGPIAVYADGSSFAEAYGITSDASGSAFGDHVFVRIDPTGNWRLLAKPASFDDKRWSMTAAGFGREVPFAGWPLFAVSSDARWFATLTTDSQGADGGTYTLSVFRTTGDTVLIRTYPYKGVPIPRSVADSAAAAENRPSTEGPGNLGAMFAQMARERIPAVYAPVQSIVLGLDDTIWLTLRDSADVRRTLVLDARGDQIGSVETSTRTRIRQADASHLWVTETDDDDLASIVRYRIRGIPCQPPVCQPGRD